MMIIDSHAHVILPVADHLSLMDEAGVDRTVLFVTTPHPEKATDLVSFAREYQELQRILAGQRSAAEQYQRMTALTRELVEVVCAHPDRFYGFGTVPLQLSPEATRRWVETEVVAHRLRGLGEFSPMPGMMHQLEPVFGAAADFGNLPVWVHTFHPCGSDDITMLLDLARKHPSVPVIAGHLGGYHWLATLQAAREIPNVYLDLSAAFSVFPPRLAMQELPERTLFASDAPYGDPLLARQMVERLSPDPAVTELVLGGNMRRLLNEPAPQQRKAGNAPKAIRPGFSRPKPY
jgi:predicted TIM-barrel fold metal-dependent hydrolase